MSIFRYLNIVIKVARTNFLRRTTTYSPDVSDTINTATAENLETTTNKFTRRGNSKFKIRKDGAEKDVPQIEKAREDGRDTQSRRPYLSSTAARNDRPTPRNFARRRFGIGGANSTTKSVSSTTLATVSRRPFRVASRRRLPSSATTTTTTTTTQSTTKFLESEEYLQDIEEIDSAESPPLATRTDQPTTPKIQRRPLTPLKNEQDQSALASNEEEKKRQSKKYSSTFKQNQLDEVLKQKAKSQEDNDDIYTEGKILDYTAETAVALAAHKLLEAPIPVIPDYEADAKPTRSTVARTTQQYKYTNSEYTQDLTKTQSYGETYSTTPIISSPTRDYIQTSTVPYPNQPTDTDIPSTGYFTSRISTPSGFSTPTVINSGLSGVSRNLGPSTSRYLSTTDQYTGTDNINLNDRYTETSEKYTKNAPTTIQYLSTVDQYSGVSYDLTLTDRYVGSSEKYTETSRSPSPTDRYTGNKYADVTRSRKPTTDAFSDFNTGTSQTLPPTDIFVPTGRKSSEVSRFTNLSTYEGYTGITREPNTSQNKGTSEIFTDVFRNTKPSNAEYEDTSNTGRSQNVKPTYRYTTTSERYTEDPQNTNPSTSTYLHQDQSDTRNSQDEIPDDIYNANIAKITEFSSNARPFSNSYVTGSSQTVTPTESITFTSEKIAEVSRKRRPSTNKNTDSENYTIETLSRISPTGRYTGTSDRYTNTPRRGRPSTNRYIDNEFTTETNVADRLTTTSERYTEGSRRTRPSKTRYTTETYTTEAMEPISPTDIFTVKTQKNSLDQSNAEVPRRRRPSSNSYTDNEKYSTVTSNTNPTDVLTLINEKDIEVSPSIRSSTLKYDTNNEYTGALQNEGFTGSNRKYSEFSRNRSPSTSRYLDSTDGYTGIRQDVVSFDSVSPNGQKSGVGQDLGSSTIQYLNPNGKSQSIDLSSTRYPITTEKYLSGPIEDFSYATGGYSQSQEPSQFTREYLLASPVTKTYDDEYQYLSPVTTQPTTTAPPPTTTQSTTTRSTSTTRKVARKKTIYRRISSTARPSSTSTTETPSRVITRKPFEKIRKVQKVKVQKLQKEQLAQKEEINQKVEQAQRVKPAQKAVTKLNWVYRPIINYDYYDDSDEKKVQKYDEGTKVILHGKGNIECLDIGNFPHPTSCKKFISCARMEGGSLIGWEYVCPKGLSFDPVGSICNWSAGLGCNESDD